LVIDSSLYGMGKGAGNTCTELIATYLNKNYERNYCIDQLLEAIDVDISKEYAKKYWGYSLMHFIAASNDCHPDYVSTLINKRTLSVQSINEILSGIDATEKLTFNKELIESTYIRYQNISIDDSTAYARLLSELGKREILIIAPGRSIETHRDKIRSFIRRTDPIVITINFINDDFKPHYVFMGNAKRYSQFFNKICKNNQRLKVVCTSNVSESNQKIDFKFNFNSLVHDNEYIRDNPVLMLLKILVTMKVERVNLAGFDGYSGDNVDNYSAEYIQFLFCNDDVLLRNEACKKAVAKIRKNIELEFLTPSLYLQCE